MKGKPLAVSMVLNVIDDFLMVVPPFLELPSVNVVDECFLGYVICHLVNWVGLRGESAET